MSDYPATPQHDKLKPHKEAADWVAELAILEALR